MLLLLPALALPFVAPAPQSLTPVGRDVFGVSPEEKEILSHLGIEMLPDGQGGLVKTLRISGINVQIVNGLGSTDTTNGLGNLVVGYNELGNFYGDDRTGSHNIVGGIRNSFASFGGFVVGERNTVSGPWCSVSGGSLNRAQGRSGYGGASVSGGLLNTAMGYYSSVSGGNNNTATYYGCVSGGRFNTAVGGSISGGADNMAYGEEVSISGGFRNSASGRWTWVGGGYRNTASGIASSVSGGMRNEASGGSTFYSINVGGSVSGGNENVASGVVSSVSGGSNRSAPGGSDWAAGSLFEDY